MQCEYNFRIYTKKIVLGPKYDCLEKGRGTSKKKKERKTQNFTLLSPMDRTMAVTGNDFCR